MLLYLALREAAHQRLFAHVPWLRDHLISAVEDFGRGVDHRRLRHRGVPRPARPDQPGGDPGGPRGRPVRAAADPGPEGRADPPGDHARPGRGLGRRGRRPGHRRSGCRPPPSSRRPSAVAVRPADPPRRPSPPWSAWSCGRAGCATPPPCGDRCGRARATRPATPSGPTPTCCRPPADLDDPLGFREDMALTEAISDEAFDQALAELLDSDAARRRADDRSTTSRCPTPGLEPARRRAGRARALAGARSRRRRRRRRRTSPTCAPVPTDWPRPASPTTSPPARSCSPHDGSQVLLNLHRKARRWFAFGGHLEPEDPTLAERRAARGHRGVRAARPGRRPRSRAPVAAHRRLLQPTRTGAALRRAVPRPVGRHHRPRGQRGVPGPAWFPVDDVPTDEPDMLDLIRLAAVCASAEPAQSQASKSRLAAAATPSR